MYLLKLSYVGEKNDEVRKAKKDVKIIRAQSQSHMHNYRP